MAKGRAVSYPDFEASNSVWRLPGEVGEPQTEAPSVQRSSTLGGLLCFLGRHSHTGWKNHRPQTRCSADCCEGESTTAAGQFMGTEGILKKGSAMPQPVPITVQAGIDAPVLPSGRNCRL